MTENVGKPALLIVDMQNDFIRPDSVWAVPGADAVIPGVRGALDWFRKNDWPVFHVVRMHRRDGSDVEHTRRRRFLELGGYALPDTEGCRVVDELAPLPHEYLLVKRRFSAFFDTELDQMLRTLKTKHLAVCGIQYPNCIRMTVFDGISLGYDVTVLTDATAAADKAVAAANIIDMENIGVRCTTLETFKGMSV